VTDSIIAASESATDRRSRAGAGNGARRISAVVGPLAPSARWIERPQRFAPRGKPIAPPDRHECAIVLHLIQGHSYSSGAASLAISGYLVHVPNLPGRRRSCVNSS